MGKLYKEAERVKLILSANTECFAQVENLLEDIDFKLAVNREDFLKLNEDYLVPERITRPIEKGRLLFVCYLPSISMPSYKVRYACILHC